MLLVLMSEPAVRHTGRTLYYTGYRGSATAENVSVTCTAIVSRIGLDFGMEYKRHGERIE